PVGEAMRSTPRWFPTTMPLTVTTLFAAAPLAAVANIVTPAARRRRILTATPLSDVDGDCCIPVRCRATRDLACDHPSEGEPLRQEREAEREAPRHVAVRAVEELEVNCRVDDAGSADRLAEGGRPEVHAVLVVPAGVDPDRARR